MTWVGKDRYLQIKRSIYDYFEVDITWTDCVSLGLFERHKLLFSFNMTIKIEQAEGRSPQEELEFFIKGEMSLTHLKCLSRWW